MGGSGDGTSRLSRRRAGIATAALAEAVATGRGKHRVPGRAQRLADPRRRSLGSPRPGLGGAIIIATIILRPSRRARRCSSSCAATCPGRSSSMAVRHPHGAGSASCHRSSCMASISSSNLVEVALGSAMRDRGPVLPAHHCPGASRWPIAGLALTGKQTDAGDAVGRSAHTHRRARVVAFGISVAIYGF